MVLGLLVFLSAWFFMPRSADLLMLRLGTLPGTGDRQTRDTQAQTPPDADSSRSASIIEDPTHRAVLCASVFALVGWTATGPVAAVVAIPLGLFFAWWIGRLESPSAARARAEIARDLPLAADLLGACAFVGRPVDESLDVVARAVGGALAARLETVGARLALGADPVAEWRRLAVDPQLAPLARTLSRTLESGAPLVGGLSRLADDCRRELRTQSQLRARNVGVKAAGPLAACFLPAFMLIGVVPTIAGAFANLVL